MEITTQTATMISFFYAGTIKGVRVRMKKPVFVTEVKLEFANKRAAASKAVVCVSSHQILMHESML